MAFRPLGFGALACAILGSTIVMTACDPSQVGPVEKLTIAGTEFTLKTALDNDSRSKGLGGVSELPENGGMLFVFPDSQVRSFWMDDCLMDIDIAYVNPLGIVTAVHTMTKEPPRGENESLEAYHNRLRLKTYSSRTPAQIAIELRPGMFNKLGIKRGSKIDLDLPRLKAAAK